MYVWLEFCLSVIAADGVHFSCQMMLIGLMFMFFSDPERSVFINSLGRQILSLLDSSEIKVLLNSLNSQMFLLQAHSSLTCLLWSCRRDLNNVLNSAQICQDTKVSIWTPQILSRPNDLSCFPHSFYAFILLLYRVYCYKPFAFTYELSDHCYLI